MSQDQGDGSPAARQAPSARKKLVSRLMVVGFILLLAAAAFSTWRNSGPPQRELAAPVSEVGPSPPAR
jgi:hypothetical protein